MTEEEWLACADPQAMIGYLGYRAAQVGGRKLRLFACGCVRKDCFTPDEFGCLDAVDTAERMGDGQVSVEEVEATQRLLERGFVVASNAWGYLVGAAAATLHPIAVEAAGLTVDNLDTFNLELTSRTDTVGYVELLRDIFGNPFRPVTVDPAWLTSDVRILAEAIYQERAFDRMPILADALMDAGCDNEDIVNHCRQAGEHVRGCWVIDLLTGRK